MEATAMEAIAVPTQPRIHAREVDGLLWKPDWAEARRALTDWWNGVGFALHVTAPKANPALTIPPAPPLDLDARWLSSSWRLRRELHAMANTFHGGVAAPMFKANIGPGSLGLFLGAEGRLAEETVWYEPVITDPANHPTLRFDPE